MSNSQVSWISEGLKSKYRQFLWLSDFNYKFVRIPTISLFSTSVTSFFFSIGWSFRPNKPYIIWWWQWPTQRHTKRQKDKDTDNFSTCGQVCFPNKIRPKTNAGQSFFSYDSNDEFAQFTWYSITGNKFYYLGVVGRWRFHPGRPRFPTGVSSIRLIYIFYIGNRRDGTSIATMTHLYHRQSSNNIVCGFIFITIQWHPSSNKR